MSNSAGVYIWDSDQSFIYYYDDEKKYFIRGKPITTSQSLSPGEIFIQSGTNNIRWRASNSTQVYQAKTLNPTFVASGLSENELFVDDLPSGEKTLNLYRTSNSRTISSSAFRSVTGEGNITRTTNVFILFDSSGSMSSPMSSVDKRRKFDVASGVIKNVIYDLPSSSNIKVGLGVLGLSNLCEEAYSKPLELTETSTQNFKTNFDLTLQRLAPKGTTPISRALSDIASNVFPPEDPGTTNILIVISDGLEECDYTLGALGIASRAVTDKNILMKVVGLSLPSDAESQFKSSGATLSFENVQTDVDLRRAIYNSIDILAQTLTVYEDSTRKNVITIEPTIQAQGISRTKIQYRSAFCRLNGNFGDFYDFTIPNIYSGYTYVVNWGYGLGEETGYTCPADETNYTANTKIEIPTPSICSGGSGQVGSICRARFVRVRWSDGSSDTAGCRTESDIGTSNVEDASFYEYKVIRDNGAFGLVPGGCPAVWEGTPVREYSGSTIPVSCNAKSVGAIICSERTSIAVYKCVCSFARWYTLGDCGGVTTNDREEDFPCRCNSVSFNTKRCFREDVFDKYTWDCVTSDNILIVRREGTSVSCLTGTATNIKTITKPVYRLKECRSERGIEIVDTSFNSIIQNADNFDALYSQLQSAIEENSYTGTTAQISSCSISDIGKNRLSGDPNAFWITTQECTEYPREDVKRCVGEYKISTCQEDTNFGFSFSNVYVRDDDGECVFGNCP